MGLLLQTGSWWNPPEPYCRLHIPIPMLGKVAERIVLAQNEREADLAMANIKAWAEHRKNS